MGQAAVRQAVQSSIQNQSFTLVGTVYPGRAYIYEQDYETNAAEAYVENAYGSSCVIVVNLPGPDRRIRLTLTGRQSVDDMNYHPIALELFFANRSGGPIQAQADYDSVVDQIVPYLRNNPTLDNQVTVWSAGEDDEGVVVRSSSPFVGTDGTTVFINGVVQFNVTEQIVGPNGV
jgi:hypothetical protein